MAQLFHQPPNKRNKLMRLRTGGFPRQKRRPQARIKDIGQIRKGLKVFTEFLRTYEFWATLIGVLMGFGLTYWYDRHVKYQEEIQNRIKTIETIKRELEENLKHISNVEDKRAALIVQFSTVAMDSAVSSGKFALLDIEGQNELATIYRNFKYAEMWSSKIFKMIGSVDMAMDTSNQTFREFNQRLYKVEESLRDQIPKAIRLLEKKLMIGRSCWSRIQSRHRHVNHFPNFPTVLWKERFIKDRAPLPS